MRYPAGVRTVAWATAIRWSGWGLVEALLPVFFYRFSGSYVETSLLTASFYAFLLLAIPLAGVFADRVSARTMLLWSLGIYVFVGLGYVTAGVFGLLAALVFARASNGIAFSFDVIARYTYLRRQLPFALLGRGFGYVTALGNFWWLVALVTSLFVVNLVPLEWLFLGIALTSGAAFLLVWRKLPVDSVERPVHTTQIVHAYRDMYRRMRRRRVGLATLAFYAFTLGLFGLLTAFLVPLFIYAHDTNLRHVVFFTGLLTVPTLFARPLGALVDRLHYRATYLGLGALVLLPAAIPFVPYAWQLGFAVLSAAAVQLLVLTHVSVVTARVKPERYGRAESVMQAASNFGTIVGTVGLGMLIPTIGTSNAFLVLAAFGLLAFGVLVWRRRYLRPLVRLSSV